MVNEVSKVEVNNAGSVCSIVLRSRPPPRLFTRALEASLDVYILPSTAPRLHINGRVILAAFIAAIVCAWCVQSPTTIRMCACVGI